MRHATLGLEGARLRDELACQISKLVDEAVECWRTNRCTAEEALRSLNFAAYESLGHQLDMDGMTPEELSG